MVVFPPESSILIRFSMIFHHPFWGATLLKKTIIFKNYLSCKGDSVSFQATFNVQLATGLFRVVVNASFTYLLGVYRFIIISKKKAHHHFNSSVATSCESAE